MKILDFVHITVFSAVIISLFHTSSNEKTYFYYNIFPFSAGINTLTENLLALNGNQANVRNVLEGDTLNFTCSHDTDRTARFHRNGYSMEDDENKDMTFGENYLTLKGIDKTDAGYYGCITYGPSTYTLSNIIEVNVNAKRNAVSHFKGTPIITLFPIGDGKVEQFDKARLLCHVEPSTVRIFKRRWFRDYQEFTPVTPDVSYRVGKNYADVILELARVEKPFEEFLCAMETDTKTYYSNPILIKTEQKIYNPTTAKRNDTNDLRLSLHVGGIHVINPNMIRESENVYLICRLIPLVIDVIELKWYHDGHELSPDTTSDNSDFLFGTTTLVIKNIKKHSTGIYSCKVNTDEGWIFSNPLKIDVKDKWNKPLLFADYWNHTDDIKNQLTHGVDLERIREFDDVFITCSLTPKVTNIGDFTWKRDNVQLVPNDQVFISPTGGMSTLLILRIDKSFAGEYHCENRNYKGQFFISDEVSIHIANTTTNVVPHVEAKFGGEFVISGDELIREFDIVYLICEIKPNRKNVRQITWYHQTPDSYSPEVVQLKPNITILFIDKNATLIFNEIKKSMTGTYHCEIETDAGIHRPSNSLEITVQDRLPNNYSITYPTVIAELLTDPENIYEKESVLFICRVYPSMEGILQIVWLRNGVDIPAGNRYSYLNQSRYLVISNVKKADVGNYTCMTLGELHVIDVVSNPVQLLKVKNRADDRALPGAYPTAVAELQGYQDDLYQCQTVYFYCDIQPKTTRVFQNRIYWMRDGQQLESSNHYSANFSERTLELRNLSNAHIANYSCQFKTNKGIITSDPTPLTKIKPRVENQPSCKRGTISLKVRLRVGHISPFEGDIFEGNDVSLTCDITPRYSTTIFDLTWHHNGHQIFSSTPKVLFSNRTMLLPGIEIMHGGNFSCQMNTKHGRIRSNEISLTIQEIPKVQLRLGGNYPDNTVQEFDNVYFTCDVSSRTTLFNKIRWIFQRKELTPNDDVDTLHRETILVLPCIKLYFAGKFYCEAVSDKGYSVRSNPVTISIDAARPNLPYPDNVCDLGSPILIAELINNPNFIYEGDEVRFFCYVYPKTMESRKINWYYHDDTLVQNTSHIPPNGNSFIYIGRTLTIPDVTDYEIGNYSCRITNYGYTFKSSNYASLLEVKQRTPKCKSLQKRKAPIVEAKFAPCFDHFSLDKFKTVCFDCQVRPKTTLVGKTSWYREGNKIDRWHDHCSFRGQILIIHNTNETFEGQYTCLVETDIGPFMSSSTPPASEIRNSSRDLFWRWYAEVDPILTVILGGDLILNDIREFDNVFLTCDIKPDRTNFRTIKWLRNGKELSELKDGVDMFYYPPRLVIPDIRKTASGSYTCMTVARSGNSVQSKPVVITVRNARRIFGTFPRAQPLVIAEHVGLHTDHPYMVYTNEDIIFHCHVYPRTTKTFGAITWYHDLDRLEPHNNYNESRYYNRSRTLIINDATEFDSGSYFCLIKVYETVVVSSVPAELFKVEPRPADIPPDDMAVDAILTTQIQNDPADDIHEKQNVFLYCDIKPIAMAYYELTWYKDGSPVNPQSGCFAVFQEQTLILHYVTKEDAGNYTCHIKNYLDWEYMSVAAALRIKDARPNDVASFDNGKPVTFVWLRNDSSKVEYIRENDDVVLTCTIEPSTTYIWKYTWKRNGKTLDPNATAGIVYRNNNLYLYAIEKKSSGYYICGASTKKGLIKSINTVELDVKDSTYQP